MTASSDQTKNSQRLKSHIAALTIHSLRSNSFGSIKIKFPIWAKAHWAPSLVRFINKNLYRIGVGAALNRYDSSITFYLSKNDENLYNDFAKDTVFCNFGSGAFHHPKWKNYDYPAQTPYYKALLGKNGVDFFSIDLCVDDLRLPFPDESVSLIYCSHTLEHLEETKAMHFLRECSRILSSNGVMRVVVPSTDNNFFLSKIIYEQNNVSDQEKNASMLSSAHYLFGHTDSLAPDQIIEDVINSSFDASTFMKNAVTKRNISNKFDGLRPDSHITHWSHNKFARNACELGFKYYLPLYKGSSTVGPFRNTDIFDTTEPHISLYGEFIKDSFFSQANSTLQPGCEKL